MTNKKESITITIPNNTTDEEIKNIRQQFKESIYSTEYKLNIIISGNSDPIENFGVFLAAWTKK